MARQNYVLATLALLLFSTPVSAEVCDKVVSESWRPSDGPFFLLGPIGLPIVFILCGGLGLVAFAGLRWLGYLASGILILIAAAAGYSAFVSERDVYLAAVQEGCLSYPTDLMNFGLVVAFAVAYGWLAYRSKQGVALGMTS